MGWKTFVDEKQAESVANVIAVVAERISDFSQLKNAAREVIGQSQFPQINAWFPTSIALGSAGTALFCSYFDASFPGTGWDEVGRRHLMLAARSLESAEFHNIGLLSGLPGLGLAAIALSQNGRNYDALIKDIDGILLSQVSDACDSLSANTGEGFSSREFDIISGIAGTGAYVLHSARAGCLMDTCQRIITELTSLLKKSGELPSWYTPRSKLDSPTAVQHSPHGNLNLGLAHGVPGPLVFLALACEVADVSEDTRAAVRDTAHWLCDRAIETPFGISWPSVIPLELKGDRLVESLRQTWRSSRAGWCYGAPGVSRALWIAGRALNDDRLKSVAKDAMSAVFRTPLKKRFIDSPTICHGLSGLLQIAMRFANEIDGIVFEEGMTELINSILAQFETESLLGFRNIEINDRRTDNPGVLDGAMGVALVLLSCISEVEPTWDRALLLS